MTKKLDPDRPNKARRGRPPKARTNSKAMKALWADPVRRAQMIAKIKAGRAIQQIEREANPQKFSRFGVPHGETKASVAPLWAEARRKADRFIQKMADEGIIPNVIIPDSDDAKGVAALHAATVLALGPTDKQLKLAAIRTVLEYTRSKPESKSKMTINTSEEFLAQIAADDASSD
jgi:hypothetical protein